MLMPVTTKSGRAPGRGKSSRPPGRPTSHSGLYAREKLIEAATELFAEQGVAATTFAMIAKRAALTPAMLHYYFKDRDQLLDAVVAERLSPLIAGVWGPVTTGENPAVMICGVVERMLDGIEKMPWVPSTWMREVLNEGGLLRTRMLRHLPREKIGAFRQSVARAQAAGDVNADSIRSDCFFADRAGDDAHGDDQSVDGDFRAQDSGPHGAEPSHYRAASDWLEAGCGTEIRRADETQGGIGA